jgi:hypothetical protein
MSSIRMNWNAFATLLLQYSSTHCGPSGTPAGGAGKPKSDALTSLPSAFLPVAIIRGTSVKWPETELAAVRSP